MSELCDFNIRQAIQSSNKTLNTYHNDKINKGENLAISDINKMIISVFKELKTQNIRLKKQQEKLEVPKQKRLQKI